MRHTGGWPVIRAWVLISPPSQIWCHPSPSVSKLSSNKICWMFFSRNSVNIWEFFLFFFMVLLKQRLRAFSHRSPEHNCTRLPHCSAFILVKLCRAQSTWTCTHADTVYGGMYVVGLQCAKKKKKEERTTGYRLVPCRSEGEMGQRCMGLIGLKLTWAFLQTKYTHNGSTTHKHCVCLVYVTYWCMLLLCTPLKTIEKRNH